MTTLNLPTIEQARAVKDALDTYMRLAIGQIDAVTELVRFGTIPLGGKRGERVLASREQIEQVEALVNQIKDVLGYTRNGSNGIGNPHVDPSGHRAYEAMKVLAKAIAEQRAPNPSFRGVGYDGLTVRYTQDPAPTAQQTELEPVDTSCRFIAGLQILHRYSHSVLPGIVRTCAYAVQDVGLDEIDQEDADRLVTYGWFRDYDPYTWVFDPSGRKPIGAK